MNRIPPICPPSWGPEPFVPQPGRPSPTPPVVKVNGFGPDANGNVQVACVMSVNGYSPTDNGAVRIPKTFYGSGAPAFAAGCIEGDTYFDRTSKHLWHFVLVGTVLTWVEQAFGYTDTVRSVNTVYVPDANGNVRIPKTFHGTGAPASVSGCIEGDSYLDTTADALYHAVSVSGTLTWKLQAAGYGCVRTVNGASPDEAGAVRIPKETTVSSHPVETAMAAIPTGYMLGDSMFCTLDNTRWVLCTVTGGYRWIRQGLTDNAKTFAQQIAETDTSHMKDSEKTALLQKLASYVKAKEGLS